MSKDLPYFKFRCDEYLTGDITLLDWSLQGIFVHICAYYWKRDCNMTMARLRQRYSQVTNEQWDTLINESKVLKHDEETGGVNITFLDEQYIELQEDHDQLSHFGKKGAQKRWANDSPPIATPSNQNSHPTVRPMAKNSKEDKDKDKDKEKIYSEQAHNLYSDLVILFDEKLRPDNKAKTDKWLWICEHFLKTNSPEHIKQIVKRARMDSFWSKNFLSLAKLNDTDKNGVKYFIKFETQFNGSNQQYSQPDKKRLNDAWQRPS